MPLNPEELFPDPFAADPNDTKDPLKEMMKRLSTQKRPTLPPTLNTSDQTKHDSRLQTKEQQKLLRQKQKQQQLQQLQQQEQQNQLQQQQKQEQEQKPREKTKEELEQEARQRLKDIETHKSEIYYSSYYYDDSFAYKHVKLPKTISRWLPHFGLLSHEEWKSLGVEQEPQWKHYMIHAPEPHILLFRREFKGIEEQLKNEEKQERMRRRKREQGGNEDKNRNMVVANNATRAAKRQKP
ncbi:regulatory subunit of cyclin-dependent kinase [Phascolomyces articulosus]|uniref:Cyclin-dependent kinases regulatory subunit n=1 Tax=Phascolomyces articulosus TaxID=60185 RepID=A0AAD5PAR2_9FUNG|nr:regulatory subunit of cyclin-dependent kinase [Phascolomyces articulosus]